MKDKQFIDAALAEMEKVYKIRNEIIPPRNVKFCLSAVRKINYYGFKNLPVETQQFAVLGSAQSSFAMLRHRFKNWSKSNIANNKEDSIVLVEIKKFVRSLNTCIDNKYANIETKPILQEARDGLEALLLIVELSQEE